MPGVLLRALSEYKFVGTPLWRKSDGKDLVRELTFHKKLPTPRFYKKGAESRSKPAPPAGEWPRQPAPATRSPPRRAPTQMERTLPPLTQTILQTPHQIIRPRYKNTATITASPTITRPAPASPVTPPPKKTRKCLQRQIARSRTAHTTTTKSTRSTRNTTSRTLSATSFMDMTLQS